MSTRPPADVTFLADLIENRIETPAVEYKSWMPLTGNVERANIARHICALANSGGGYLVFGFKDDGTADPAVPPSLGAYGHDAINGIVERYLAPPPHCETHVVTSNAGIAYPVIRVPSHGEQPVCAKRDGPTENGRPSGISSGVHYVRIAGPKSVPINTPALWSPVIRRCVFAERSTLLSSIGQLFIGAPPPQTTAATKGAPDQSVLSDWNRLSNEFWPVPLAQNRIMFSFRFLSSQGRDLQPVPLSLLLESIRSASFGSADDVRDGGASFEAGWRPDRMARVTLIGDDEGYEACILPTSDDRYVLPALWRVTATGHGVDVVAIPEDNDWIRSAVEGKSSRRWPSGARFSPTFQIQHVAQHIAFAGRLTEAYPEAVSCELAVDYLGLKDRIIGEPRAGVHFSLDRRSAVDGRRVVHTVGVASLLSDLPAVTAALVGPILRLFDGWEVDAAAVAAILGRSN